jgi:hypothetical protein
MKKGLLLLLAATLMMIGCGKKAEVQEEKEPTITIQMYVTPIPDFSKILDDLDKLGKVNLTRIIRGWEETNPTTMDKVAFQFGAGVADALVSLKAKHKSSLMEKTKTLISYAEVLGVSEKYLKLSDSLRVYIEQENWSEVENQMNIYKQAILDEFYNLESYDSVVLIQFGGWIRGLQNVSNIVMNDVKNKEATTMLGNKMVVNALLHDLPKMSDETLRQAEYFQHSLTGVEKIKAIIFASQDDTFSPDEVKNLHELAKQITKNFDK